MLVRPRTQAELLQQVARQSADLDTLRVRVRVAAREQEFGQDPDLSGLLDVVDPEASPRASGSPWKQSPRAGGGGAAPPPRTPAHGTPARSRRTPDRHHRTGVTDAHVQAVVVSELEQRVAALTAEVHASAAPQAAAMRFSPLTPRVPPTQVTTLRGWRKRLDEFEAHMAVLAKRPLHRDGGGGGGGGGHDGHADGAGGGGGATGAQVRLHAEWATSQHFHTLLPHTAALAARLYSSLSVTAELQRNARTQELAAHSRYSAERHKLTTDRSVAQRETARLQERLTEAAQATNLLREQQARQAQQVCVHGGRAVAIAVGLLTSPSMCVMCSSKWRLQSVTNCFQSATMLKTSCVSCGPDTQRRSSILATNPSATRCSFES